MKLQTDERKKSSSNSRCRAYAELFCAFRCECHALCLSITSLSFACDFLNSSRHPASKLLCSVPLFLFREPSSFLCLPHCSSNTQQAAVQVPSLPPRLNQSNLAPWLHTHHTCCPAPQHAHGCQLSAKHGPWPLLISSALKSGNARSA